jgi:hypothetical protein
MAITLSEVRAYVLMFEVEDVEFFYDCIRQLDRVYLDDYEKRHPKPPPPAQDDRKKRRR